MGQLVGLALRQMHTCPIEINLLPPKAEEEKKFKRKQPIFAMTAVVILLTLIVWISFYARVTGVTENIRGQIDVRVGELSGVEQRLIQAEAAVAEVEGKISKLTALESRRGIWRSLLGEISAPLPAGMWLTRVSPLAVLPGGAPPAEGASEPVAAPAQSAQVVAGIEIEGIGYLDRIKSSEAISAYRDQLRASKWFSDKTEIVWQPPARQDASTLEFKILAVLEAPQEL
jgi:Tfp pilus assembly protein PilN